MACRNIQIAIYGYIHSWIVPPTQIGNQRFARAIRHRTFLILPCQQPGAQRRECQQPNIFIDTQLGQIGVVQPAQQRRLWNREVVRKRGGAKTWANPDFLLVKSVMTGSYSLFLTMAAMVPPSAIRPGCAPTPSVGSTSGSTMGRFLSVEVSARATSRLPPLRHLRVCWTPEWTPA